jgi:hypothetical protein
MEVSEVPATGFYDERNQNLKKESLNRMASKQHFIQP